MKTKLAALIFISIIFASCAPTTVTPSIDETLTPVITKESVVTNTPTEVPTESPTVTPTTTPVDVLTFPTAQLVNEVINGQMEYPTNLQELSQEKYEEFSILFAQELNALTPEDYVIDKRIGLTSYDIYWNEAKVEWDAVTVKSGQENNNPGEFYPVVVPFYQNENGQWCTTDENTGVEIVIPDKYLNGKSFMEWAQAGPIELNAQIPELMVNAKLAVEPDTSAEKLDAIRKEYLINRPLKLVAVINPNHPQGNNITAAKWFGSVKGPTIDFPEEGAKIIEHSTNTLMVPIILNGKPVAAINVAQRFRGVYIAVEFDQNGNVVDASGWGDGTSGGFGQKPNDNWVLVLALKSPDSAEGAGGGDIFNETDTADYFTVLSGIQNASSVNQIKKILEGTNFIYGEAYDLIFQR